MSNQETEERSNREQGGGGRDRVREEEGKEVREEGGQGQGPGPGEGEEGAVEVSSASTPDLPVDGANGKRIGPWDSPVFSRQTALADRLSNPAQPRSSHRPHTPVITASLANPATIRSPYASSAAISNSNGRPRGANANANNHTYTSGSRMSSAKSAPPGSGWSSPRRDGSPRRQLSTPRYGSVSPRRQPPLFPTPSNTRKVSEQELDGIVMRVTRPTVASRGGVDLLDKDFTYIKPRRLKTLPVVPGLERRYMGLQVVDTDKMQEIVSRLTRMTSAYTAKFAPNRNVWIDMEPGAHMVQRGNAQSV